MLDPREAVRIIIVATVLTSSGAIQAGEENAEPFLPFGFSSLETYRASTSSAGLQIADMDGDGRLDLVYAYNTDTSIRVLYQRAAADGEEEKLHIAGNQAESDVNEIEFDGRFRVEKYYSEKEIDALLVGDVNGDSRPDIVFYGDPAELVVLYQGKEWGARKEAFSISDGDRDRRALKLVDLNRDGRLDIVLLGRGKTYLMRQDSAGAISQPEVLYNVARDSTSIDVVDVDGNGFLDLVTVEKSRDDPLVVRFQYASGFGPEARFEMFTLMDWLLTDLDGDHKAEVFTIQGNTRRVLAYRWTENLQMPANSTINKARETGEQSYLTAPRLFAFRPDSEAASRRVAFGDVNGDGREDVVVTYGQVAEADVLLQNDQGELERPVSSPTLSDVRGIDLGDFDGRGGPELLFVSQLEKALGQSRWLESGRLSIPRTTPVEEDPLLFSGCDLSQVLGDGSAVNDLEPRRGFFLVGRNSTSSYVLKLQCLNDDGSLRTLSSLDIEAGAQPNGLRVMDLDGDGLEDVLVFVPYDNPRFFLCQPNDEEGGLPIRFHEISREKKDFGISQLAKLGPAAVSLARFPDSGESGEEAPSANGRDDLLVVSKSHARALRFGKDSTLEILEQFSGRGASADLSGAVALNLDADPSLEVLLFDRSAASLFILDRGERDVYREVRKISVPGFKFLGFEVRDLNTDGREDVVLLGEGALAVFYRGSERHGLVEFLQFDPGDERYGKVEDYGKPVTLCLGDLNADGRKDLILATHPRYYLTFLRPENAGPLAGMLEPAMRFQIFEEKSFMRRRGSHGPREMEVADLTGDGKDDLVMLIHDRLLIYVQE